MKSDYRRIGLISTMSPDKTWAQEVVDGVANTHGVVKNVLQHLGFEVLDAKEVEKRIAKMKL